MIWRREMVLLPLDMVFTPEVSGLGCLAAKA